MNIFTRSLVLVMAMLSSAAAQTTTCSMCSDADATLANPDLVVPFFGLNDENNPTCREIFEFAPSAPTENCAFIQAQGNFCGCPGSSGPVNECSFCPDGSSPQAPKFLTPFGDSCEDLDWYASHITAADCETDRVKLLLRSNFICECPNVTPVCSMCPDNTLDLGNADAVIPFLSTPDDRNPTCAKIRNSASLVGPGDDFDCTTVQVHAGFCGCAGIEPQNVCSFCPTGESPTKLSKIVPTSDSCEDIETYVSFLDEEGCESPVTQSLLGLGYICGCPGAQPSCTLCPDGAAPIDNDVIADGPTTCGEFADIVGGLTPGLCEAQSLEIQAAAARCCGGDIEFPVCSIQQNPSMCTDDLLATTDEECECYSFCDDEFVECTKFPGSILLATRCLGQAVTGCNPALATGGSSAAFFDMSVSALMIAFAVAVGIL